MDSTDASLPLLAESPVSETAVELREVAKKVSQERLYALPYNRFDPDNSSSWWVLNSPEKPAFRFGKIIVTKDPAVIEPGDRFIGLHIEKGVEGNASAMFTEFRGEAFVMNSSWRWPELVRAWRTGRFAEQAVEAESAAGRPLTVALVAGRQRLPDNEHPEHRSEDHDADVARFVCRAGQLEPLQGTRRKGHLDDLAKTTSFADIAGAIRSIEEVDFVWVEFFIGLRFGLTRGGADGVWTARDVWDRVCEPWHDWVR